RLGSRCLRLMRCGIVEGPVGPDDHVKKIVEAERCDDVEAIVGLQTHTQSLNNGRVSRESIVGTPQRRIVSTEATLEPEGHRRLLGTLYRSGKRPRAMGTALFNLSRSSK